MPIYIYEEIQDDGSEGDCFEIQQSIHDAPLTHHPETGNPVRKVFLAPNLGSKHSPNTTKNRLDNKNLDRLGFTKYQKDKLTGDYYRVAGKNGPEVLDPKKAKGL
jgi:hypothetical protein